MGSFKFFKSHKSKDSGSSTPSPPPPPGDLPQPLWALATQPSPKRLGFSSGVSEAGAGKGWGSGEATLQKVPPRRKEESVDKVARVTKGMTLLETGEESYARRGNQPTPPATPVGARQDIPSPKSRPSAHPLGMPSPSSNLLVFHPSPRAEERREDVGPFAPYPPRQVHQQRPLPPPPIPSRPYYSTELVATYTPPPHAPSIPPRGEYRSPSSTHRPPYVQAPPPPPQDHRPPPPPNYPQHPPPHGSNPYLQSVPAESRAPNPRDSRQPPLRGPDPYLQSISNAPGGSNDSPLGITTSGFLGAFPDEQDSSSQDPRSPNWPPPPPPQHPTASFSRHPSSQQPQRAFDPPSLVYHQQFSQQPSTSPFRPTSYSAPAATYQSLSQPQPNPLSASAFRDSHPIPPSSTPPHWTSNPRPHLSPASPSPKSSLASPTPSPTKPKPSPLKPKSKPAVIDLCSSDSDTAYDTAPSLSTSRSSSPEKNQCCGTTATSRRCTRLVVEFSSSPSRSRGASPAPFGLDTLDEILRHAEADEGGEREEVPRFCFQHAKQAMGERGCFVGTRGVWIEFDDWILPHLPTVTKILLRHEMARPPSDKDEEGYIYVHEMVEKRSTFSHSHTHRTTFLKLGRSIKPVSRLAQWRSQCPSREPIVRDIFPRASNTSSAGAGLSGALRIAERGIRHHHRWERLMLIEVAGRAGMEAEERRRGVGSKEKPVCEDCGKVHVELFEVGEGAYEDWVREVVERWGRWCCDVLG